MRHSAQQRSPHLSPPSRQTRQIPCVKTKNTRYDLHSFLRSGLNFFPHLLHSRVWNTQSVEETAMDLNERRVSVALPARPIERLSNDGRSPSPGHSDKHLARDSQNSRG